MKHPFSVHRGKLVLSEFYAAVSKSVKAKSGARLTFMARIRWDTSKKKPC